MFRHNPFAKAKRVSGYFLGHLAKGCTLRLLPTMNATQPSRRALEAPEPRRRTPRVQKQRRSEPYRAIALETFAKLAVNVTLSIAAVAALVQLLPYHFSTQTKLREIREEVKQTQARVNGLQNEFKGAFDPQQAKSVMQQQSYRVDPARRQIVLMDKNRYAEEQLTEPQD